MTTGTRLVTLHRTVLLAGIWAALTGAEPKGLVFGALAVPAAVWMSLRLMPAGLPLRPVRLARHLGGFVAGSVRGGLDVARRAVAPAMPVAPGWVAVPLALPPGARAAIGGELSLMPGTLAAGCRDGRLLVHLIDTRAGFERAIPARAEALARLAGLRGTAGRE
jgi:multicomponent Na+:H+ antiporter subunit E